MQWGDLIPGSIGAVIGAGATFIFNRLSARHDRRLRQTDRSRERIAAAAAPLAEALSRAIAAHRHEMESRGMIFFSVLEARPGVRAGLAVLQPLLPPADRSLLEAAVAEYLCEQGYGQNGDELPLTRATALLDRVQHLGA